MLGHGQSDKPHDPEHYEENRIVSDIIAVLDAEQIDRALVWGYSMGARNACSLAAMEPSRVGAVVAGGFALLPGTDARRDNFVALGKTASTVEGLEGALRMLGADDDFIRPSLERNDTAALSACLVGFARYFPAASDVNCPSLWYSGTDDVALKAARHEVMDLAKQLHVETRDVPDASHVGAFLCSGEVLAFVKPFLDTASE